VAGLQRVFIDTSELYPFTLMDLLLNLSEDLLFTWVWSDELLDEWERVIVSGGGRTKESAISVTDAVRGHFGRYRLDPERYRGRVVEGLSPDPADRIHAAACIHGAVDVLLTRNKKHFWAVAEAGVDVASADEYLCALLNRRPSAVINSFGRLVDSKRNPPLTSQDFADRLEKAGAQQFATLLRHRLQ